MNPKEFLSNYTFIKDGLFHIKNGPQFSCTKIDASENPQKEIYDHSLDVCQVCKHFHKSLYRQLRLVDKLFCSEMHTTIFQIFKKDPKMHLDYVPVANKKNKRFMLDYILHLWNADTRNIQCNAMLNSTPVVVLCMPNYLQNVSGHVCKKCQKRFAV